MKHIFIFLISIILLSFPVFGDGNKLYRFDSSLDSRSSLSIINYGETLYGWGEYPDYVWKGVGEKGTHHVYKGEVENGVPNGLGILIYPNGVKYVGSWKDGGWLNGTEYLKGGRIFNGIIYNKDRQIIWKVVNGKYIKP